MPRTTLLAVILATAILSACATAATVALMMPPAASAGSSDVAVLRQIRGELRHMDTDIGYQPGTSLLDELQAIKLKLTEVYSRQAFVCRAISDRPLDCPSPVG